jgi:hypothetical protein
MPPLNWRRAVLTWKVIMLSKRAFSNREDAILFYLLAARFPRYAAHVREADLLNPSREWVKPETPAAEITAYFDELERKSALEREALFTLARQEVRNRIALERHIAGWVLDHDHPVYALDAQWWAIQPSLSADECAWILLGKDPRAMNWDDLKQQADGYVLAAKFRDLRDLLNRALSVGHLRRPVSAASLLEWVRGKIEPPAGLKDAVKALPPLPGRKDDDRLETRERTSALKLIEGMAVAFFEHDPELKGISTVSTIVTKLRTHGYTVDEGTVRKYLREAKERQFRARGG